MKKSLLQICLLGCCTPFLIQCIATEEQFRGLDLKMRTMDNNMVNIERKISNNSKMLSETAKQESVEKLFMRNADSGASLDEIKSELHRLQGLIDENAHFSSELATVNTATRDDLKQQINQLYSKIDTRVATLSDRVTALEDKNLQIIGEIEQIQGQQVKEAADRAEMAARALTEAQNKVEKISEPIKLSATKHKQIINPTGPPSSAETPLSQPSTNVATQTKGYDKALTLFNNRQYQQAREEFQDFIKNNPNNDRVINAKFYIADCQFNLKEYENAILEYQKIVADYPNHNMAPAALLKQGLSFEQINDKDIAKIVYRKLADTYPRSEEAKTAEKRLKNL